MVLKRLFASGVMPAQGDVGLLLLRLLAGTAMAMHGWGKIQNPTGWMGPEAFAPPLLQLLAAVSEFGGGIAWALGLLTRLASFGVACTMGVAVYMHAVMMGDPFVPTGPGQGAWELAGLYLMLAVFLMLAGPGGLSLDRAIFGNEAAPNH